MLAGRLFLVTALVAGCQACSDDAAKHDAAIDVSTIDGPCPGGGLYFTGDYIDWDSTDTDFCGVFNATWQVRGGTVMDKTSPNGRFEMCIPSAATTTVDVTPATGPSGCTGPTRTYAIPGIAVANKSVIETGKQFTARALPSERRDAFYAQAGTSYDVTKAGVFVHFEGTPRAVSISAQHDTTMAYSGTTWMAGSTGKDVFFPNVTVGGGTTMVTAGGATGEGAIPIAANTFTYVTLVAP